MMLNSRVFVGISVLSILLITISLYTYWTHNSLEARANSADEEWLKVEAVVQERFDLLPNLLEASKVISQEKPLLFIDIEKARTDYANSKLPEARAEAAARIEISLSDLVMEIQNHSNVKNQANIKAILDKLTALLVSTNEKRIAFNKSLKSYNDAATRFPSNMVAEIFGFNRRSYLTAV